MALREQRSTSVCMAMNSILCVFDKAVVILSKAKTSKKKRKKKKWGIFKSLLFEEIPMKGRSAAFYSKNLVVVWLLTADRYCHPAFRGKFCMLTAAGNGRREEAGFWGRFLNTRSEVATSESPSQTLNVGCDFSRQTRGLIPHLSRVVSSREAPRVAYLCLLEVQREA